MRLYADNIFNTFVFYRILKNTKNDHIYLLIVILLMTLLINWFKISF